MKKAFVMPIPHNRIISYIQETEFYDWGMYVVGAEKIWSKYTGKGINLAILDTGVDAVHPDLKQNIKGGYNIFTKTSTFVDGHGHGTHVAGISGAVRNGVGVTGVAPDVNIYGVKVLRDEGWGYLDDIAMGFEWCLENNIDVINMSIGTTEQILLDSRIYKAIKNCFDKGIIIVVAAGNNYKGSVNTLSEFAKLDETIAVGAIGSVNEELVSAPFSSKGWQIDYAMPGVDIISTFPGANYLKLSGTSMASPYMAGVVCILQQWSMEVNKRKLNFNEVNARLKGLSKDLGFAGFDVDTGFGLVQVDKILQYVTPPPTKVFWRVQVGAFSVKQNAINLLESIKKLGYAAILKEIDGLWKVQLGAFSVEENARKFLVEVRGKVNSKAFLVHY